MIIAQQTQGSSLSDLVVDEVAFQTGTGATDILIASFEYDGADWQYDGNTITTQQLEENYGISFAGTPVNTDTIVVAYQPTGTALHYFSPGKGINQVKINYDFSTLQQQANSNESAINTISATALKKDGSNLTQTIIDEFQQQTPNVITSSGAISLTDNTANFLTLTGDGSITLPTVASDSYSHTITLVVEGGEYSLSLGTAYHLYSPVTIDTTETYNVMYIYNKIDGNWYYYLTQ